MRIISQDGSKDVSYANAALSEEDGVIFVYTDGMSLGRKFASYSSSEKAKKVMKLIQDEHVKHLRASSASFFFAFYQPKIFIMPQEEEVEVDGKN